MSEETIETVETVETVEAAPEPKPSPLDILEQELPMGTEVVYIKTDDKGKRGTVTGYTEKFGVAYPELLVQLAHGKTKVTTPRASSIRKWTDEDEAAFQEALAAKQAEKEAKEAEKAVTPTESAQVIEAESTEDAVKPRQRRRK